MGISQARFSELRQQAWGIYYYPRVEKTVRRLYVVLQRTGDPYLALAWAHPHLCSKGYGVE